MERSDKLSLTHPYPRPQGGRGVVKPKVSVHQSVLQMFPFSGIRSSLGQRCAYGCGLGTLQVRGVFPFSEIRCCRVAYYYLKTFGKSSEKMHKKIEPIRLKININYKMCRTKERRQLNKQTIRR